MILSPGGYLSPSFSQWPWVTSDVAPTDKLYWTQTGPEGLPVVTVPGVVEMTQPGQLALQFDPTHHLVDKAYQVSVIWVNSTPVLVTSPAWTGRNTTGAGAQFLNYGMPYSLPMNVNQITMRNGSNAWTVNPANAIWLGTICPCENGKIRIDMSAGTNRRRDVANLWNKRRVELRITDIVDNEGEDEWSITSRHPDYANGNPGNSATFVTCTPSRIEAEYYQGLLSQDDCNTVIALCYNSETYATGQLPQPYPGQTKPGALKFRGYLHVSGRKEGLTGIAQCTIPDAVGVNWISLLNWIESFPPGTPNGNTIAEYFDPVKGDYLRSMLWSREYSMLGRVMYEA